MPIIYNTLMFIAIWFIYEVFHFPTVSSFLYGESINVFLTIIEPVIFALMALTVLLVVIGILVPLVVDGYAYSDPRNPLFIGYLAYAPSILYLIDVNMEVVTMEIERTDTMYTVATLLFFCFAILILRYLNRYIDERCS